MAFFYDKINGGSCLAQYVNYLENEEYLAELKDNTRDALNYQLIEVRKCLAKSSEQSLRSFEKLTNDICGTLERGFDQIGNELIDINWRLNEIDERVEGLHIMLDWKTDLIIEGQKITNLYLGKVIQMLKIPDSQKQRGYYVEQGLTYLKNAIIEGPKSDFYSDALDEFSKAKKIEEKDYFCLHKLGLIYLNSVKHLDVKKSEEYFKLSARYSKAAANASPQVNSGSNYETFTERQLLEETASALIYASKANYILDNSFESIRLAQQAVEFNPNNLDYKLHLAKCLSTSGQHDLAADFIIDTIRADKNYAIKALTDPDFMFNEVITAKIDQFTTEHIRKIDQEMNSLSSVIKEDSLFKSNFNQLQQKFSQKNYLNARDIECELTKSIDWNYDHYNNQKFEKDNSILPTVEKKFIKGTLSEIIRIEAAEHKNRIAFLENYAFATKVIAKNRADYQNRRDANKLLKVAIALAVSIVIWYFAGTMDGWFLAGLIKIADLVATGIAVYYIIWES